MSELNVVYLRSLPMRQMGRGYWATDASLLPFVVEELIAHSAVGVAVAHHYSKLIPELAPTLRNRVRTIDSESAKREVRALLEPIIDEFNCYDPRECRLFFGEATAYINTDLCILFNDLATYVVAIRNGLQIELNLTEFRRSLRAVRRVARNPEGRAVLASIDGILSAYENVEAKALVAVPVARPELITVFEALLEDKAYLASSMRSRDLAFPRKLKRSLVLIRRACERIIAHKKYRQLFNLGTRAIGVATHLPVPDSDVAQRLLEAEGLPAIVRLGRPIRAAIRSWEHVHGPAHGSWLIQRP